MKKTIIILFILTGLTNSYGQELNGVWMSYNNRIVEGTTYHTTGDEGIIIDFDNSTMGHIKTDTVVKIKVNFRKSKIKSRALKAKIKFRQFGQDSIEMNGLENTIYVFRKLDLAHEIDLDKNEISDFLITHQFDSIQGIKGEFSGDKFFRDITLNTPQPKNQFVNKNWNDNGYWSVKKIKGNAFLIFTIGQTEPNNILQILSISQNGLKLNQLQTDEWMENLTEIKTCL
ncbi:hypothetical protein [Costertonia aggregata]|uniref:Uncharacterized protein n=1 Tax=Costertonia aggregata TaxID=343403 RepID=A0A7H9APG8_9FLAO|nr:hypothetical protein [Costertonia aggregata]QLG45304.1 hypothetical protein HYG79_08070 [Costertonia aggregata]